MGCANCGGRVTGDGDSQHCEGCGMTWDFSNWSNTGKVLVSDPDSDNRRDDSSDG